MNPELPQVRPGVEAMPQIPGGAEYFPDGTVKSPEVAPNYERPPARPEQQPRPSAQPPVTAPPPQVATPHVSQPARQDSQADDLVADAPQTAADDDLMEKEWVDKLKSIIALTKGNPYEQARAIAALQADYLRKRHNRVIGEG